MPNLENSRYLRDMKSVIQNNMAEIIRMGRSIGMYCILATQRGTIDMMPSFIKNMANTKSTMKVNGTKSTEVNGFPGSDKLLKREFMVETDKIYLGRTGNLTPENVLNFVKEFKVPNKINFDFIKYSKYLDQYGIISDIDVKKKKEAKNKRQKNKKEDNDVENITVKNGVIYDDENKVIELEEPIKTPKKTTKKLSKEKGASVQEKIPQSLKGTPKVKDTPTIKDTPKVKDTAKKKDTPKESISDTENKPNPKIKNEVFKIHQNRSPYYDPNWTDITKNPNVKIIDERKIKKHD